MSDDIKTVIADALVRDARERHYWMYNPYGLAEVAFDAAVEAGMAPPDEVERLREAQHMVGRELKALFRAFRERDELAFRRAALTIIEEEERKQHLALARDLRVALDGEDMEEDG